MKFSAKVADHFDQSRFNERMHILGGCIFEIPEISPFVFKNLLESRFDLLRFIRTQHASAHQAVAVSDDDPRQFLAPILALEPFLLLRGCSVRDGRAEAILAPDDRLYCYGTDCADEAFASEAREFKRVA